MSRASIILYLAAASALSGCGVVFQAIAGYDERESRVERVDTTLGVSSLPEGAAVSEMRGDVAYNLGTTALRMPVHYERALVVSKPASMKYYWLGTGLDALLVTGAAIGAAAASSHTETDARKVALWVSWTQLPLGLIAEIVAGAIVGSRDPSIVSRIDHPRAYQLSIRKPEYPPLLASISVPAAAPGVTIPLDPRAALALNRVGSPVTVTLAGTPTVSASPIR